MMKSSKRVIGLMLVLVLSLGALAACTKTEDPVVPPVTDPEKDPAKTPDVTPEVKPEPVKTGGLPFDKDLLKIATANEPGSIHTADHNAVAGDYVNKMNYNTLLKLDVNLDPVPSLATGYEVIDDTTWEMKLRDDVIFHNGDKMTSADVAESLMWVKQFPQSKQYNAFITDVQIMDEYTVRLITDGPQANLPWELAYHANMILPKSLMDIDHDFGAEPVGTGPYKFVRWDKGQKIVMEAHEEYYEGAPKIKNLEWVFIKEASSRTISLETGEVGMVIEVARTAIDQLVANEDIETVHMAASTLDFMMMNNEIAPFNNQNFRKALNAAIDRNIIVKASQEGFAEAVYSQLPIFFESTGASEENTVYFDPVKAVEYLEASGLDPKTSGFAIICSDDLKAISGQIIQDSLRTVLGVETTIERMDLAKYLSVTNDGDYEAAIGGYSPASLIYFLKGVFHSASVGGSNKTRTAVPELDAFIDAANAELHDDAKRIEILQDASAFVNDLCPQVPLFHEIRYRAFNNHLKGMTINPSGHFEVGDLYWED